MYIPYVGSLLNVRKAINKRYSEMEKIFICVKRTSALYCSTAASAQCGRDSTHQKYVPLHMTL